MKNMLEGLRVGEKDVMMNVLQFTDDTLFFMG